VKLNNKKLYELLKEKGVTNLFHANTVATSITYIEEGGLLSREYIEDQELYQTPQTSDEIDKLFDVFDDIFIDTIDLHKNFNRQNHYGPVLFQFSLELLLDDNIEIWVTKDNPIYWAKNSDVSENYFKSVKELSKEWDNHEIQRKMFTIKKPNEPILFNYLESITLDNPKVLINDDVSLRLESRKAFKKATKDKPEIRKMLVWRECGYCFCTDNYLNQVPTPELAQKFLPVYHAEFEE
jgi:hypothetical protein